jgi:hypothetical protein
LQPPRQVSFKVRRYPGAQFRGRTGGEWRGGFSSEDEGGWEARRPAMTDESDRLTSGESGLVKRQRATPLKPAVWMTSVLVWATVVGLFLRVPTWGVSSSAA